MATFWAISAVSTLATSSCSVMPRTTLAPVRSEASVGRFMSAQNTRKSEAVATYDCPPASSAIFSRLAGFVTWMTV